ncbi:MAG: 3-hydroxyacyl-CoA dehydrogenase family protein [Gemmatimonadota bacterium]
MSISTVAILGAGTMGRRIAYSCVLGGLTTRLYDSSPQALEGAVPDVRALIERRQAREHSGIDPTDAVMKRLVICRSIQEAVDGTDLVIETVTENVAAKRAVFAEADRYAPLSALIGSNTSSIPGSKLASATARPDKVFNFNWGTPEHVKVEVMTHPGTAPETLEAAVRFVRSLGLVPIVVAREIMGYASNRVWRAVKKEVLHLLDGGYISAEDVDRAWMLDWETPIGPCGLMDKVGLDVVRDIEMIYHGETGDRSDRPPKLLDDMIAAGKLGVKSGQGFYSYPNPAYREPGWLLKSDRPE